MSSGSKANDFVRLRVSNQMQMEKDDPIKCQHPGHMYLVRKLEMERSKTEMKAHHPSTNGRGDACYSGAFIRD